MASVETTGSPTFLGNLDCAFALLSDPGGTDPVRPLATDRRGPRPNHNEGSTRCHFRGSMTQLRHWLSTLCRTGHPAATQDSLPAVGQTLPDGLAYPQGSSERFQSVCYTLSSFPKFSWRKVRPGLGTSKPLPKPLNRSLQIQTALLCTPHGSPHAAVVPIAHSVLSHFAAREHGYNSPGNSIRNGRACHDSAPSTLHPQY